MGKASARQPSAPRAKVIYNDLAPQPGPQTKFLESHADIVIYGGAAGGGKSYAILMACLRHVKRTGYQAVVFRRKMTDITKPGALWDTSMQVYGTIHGAVPNLVSRSWKFPSKSVIAFGHLQHESTMFDWKGAQIALLCFDELTTFSIDQFFYLMSRMRTTCGIVPYVLCTTNPDADSWVRGLVDWWIDGLGFPIHERSGVLRWMARVDDRFVWADSKAQLLAENPGLKPNQPKSITFIPAKLSDNKKIGDDYEGNLMMQNRVEAARLLSGNWNIRPSGGMFYQAAKVRIVDAAPSDTRWMRGWDLAATRPHEKNPDPDWTVGVLIGHHDETGITYIGGMVELRDDPAAVKALVKSTAERDDGRWRHTEVRIALARDPGQAGKDQESDYGRLLRQHDFLFRPTSGKGSKVKRFGPFSSQVLAGNVRMLREDPEEQKWNERLNAVLEAFPEGAHDDHADACSEAYNALMEGDGSFESWKQLKGRLR